MPWVWGETSWNLHSLLWFTIPPLLLAASFLWDRGWAGRTSQAGSRGQGAQSLVPPHMAFPTFLPREK